MRDVVALGLDADRDLSRFAAALAKDGIKVVLRYLKNLTTAETGLLHLEGLLVGMIFETSAERALLGAAAGAEDGAFALRQAQALGAPPNAAIYATVDNDVGTSQLAAIEAYGAAFGGCLTGKARFGGYGSGLVLTTLQKVGMELPWLAGASGWAGFKEFLATGAPAIVQGPTLGGGTWSPEGMPPIVWPRPGFVYDPDIIFADDVGAW